MTSTEGFCRKRKGDDKDPSTKIKPFPRHATTDTLSWPLTGAMVLLVTLLSVMIVRDYGRETTAAR